MTEKRARTSLSKVRIPYFEREFTPVKPARSRVRFKTVDDVVFEVCDTSIVPSTYMNRLIYGTRLNKQQSSEVTHTLPNVAADVFEKVMRYCYFHTSRYCDNLLPNQVTEWDDQFMDLDPRQLCELASAAYYLDVKDLIELTCRAIAAIISGKTAQEIRKTFHIENDLAGTIDRVLPGSARRRGREHSPKAKRDTSDNTAQQRNQSELQQHNPSEQKSVDELTEWINSSSSKSKKKKKKRNKDRNPGRRGCEDSRNDDEVFEAEALHRESNETQVPEITAEDVNLLFEAQESADVAHQPFGGHRGIDDRDASNDPAPMSSNYGHSEEIPPGSDPDHEGGSSSSDVAFVSEKRVSRAAVEEISGIVQHSNALNRSSRAGRTHQLVSMSKAVNMGQDEVCTSAASDGDSVQWVPPNSSSQSHPVKDEKNVSESSSDGFESSESDAEIASHQREHSDDENRERGSGPKIEKDDPSRMGTEAPRNDVASIRPLKEDISMVDDPENPAPLAPVPHDRTTEEAFINCPENMDREVEAFQQRLSITEPLPHRSAPQMPVAAPTVSETGGRSRLHDSSADDAWTPNGVISEDPAILRPMARPGSSNNRTITNTSLEGQEQIGRDNGHNAVVRHSSIPKEVMAELLRINSEKEAFQKIATAIDEETARLGAKREKIRDSLAVLNMQASQLRLRYNVPDRFP